MSGITDIQILLPISITLLMAMAVALFLNWRITVIIRQALEPKERFHRRQEDQLQKRKENLASRIYNRLSRAADTNQTARVWVDKIRTPDGISINVGYRDPQSPDIVSGWYHGLPVYRIVVSFSKPMLVEYNGYQVSTYLDASDERVEQAIEVWCRVVLHYTPENRKSFSEIF